jgi:DNA helicase-2/ATP-dependent DNA helicase PcrA
LFVAYQDYEREEKAIKAEDGRDEGTVHILRFENQYDEATGVASIAAHILRSEKYEPDELLVLIRSDRYGAYSRVLQQAITAEGIECVTGTGDTPLDESLGRRFIALLRLADNPRDHLAIRSLLQLTPGIGAGSLKRLYQVARADNSTFFDAVQRVIANPQLLGSGGPRLAKTAQQYQAHASTLGLSLTLLQVTPSKDRLRDELGQLAIALASPGEDTAELVAFIDLVIDEGEAQTLPEFFAAIHTLGDDADQQVIKGKINILTMHKAKGLAAKAVFVVGCEDEQLPGRNENEPELGDERRLLYVSLTRAEHYLFVTYCLNRLDQQSHYGRPSSSASRRLTRFLREGPVAPSSGSDYTESFSEAALVR